MRTNRSRILFVVILGLLTTTVIFSGCKKDDDIENAKVNIKISDPRSPQSSNKTSTEGIINSDLLTKCEVTFSSISLKNSEGEYVELLASEKTVDLRDLQGTVGDLVSADIPIGTYSHIKVVVSGVSTTYSGNNYTASVSGGATATLSSPAMTLTEEQGVTNVFSGGAISFECPLAFTLSDVSDIENVNIQFDTDATTYVITFTYDTYTWSFAGIRPALNVSFFLEEGIQQIRHSPPYGITIVSMDAVDYYGIHTFVDFNQNGGVINSHTSQHVFRGSDGTLTVDAEAMYNNTNALVPNTINATGESDVRSDETFNYSQIVTNLANQGYDLVSGQTYYFSLRKTWNITTNGTTYDMTRMCEPIPVTIP
ncbi:MAG TPA: DUF4382 domain-containing protein [Bacteroidales bacterium]|nr:DUF4382 domain-containing protein [Bacteroidales bacterium]